MPEYIFLHCPEMRAFDEEIIKKSSQPKKHTESMPFTKYFQAVFIKTDQVIDVDLNRDKDTKRTKWRPATIYVFTHIRQRGAKKGRYYIFNPKPERADARRY